MSERLSKIGSKVSAITDAIFIIVGFILLVYILGIKVELKEVSINLADDTTAKKVKTYDLIISCCNR